MEFKLKKINVQKILEALRLASEYKEALKALTVNELLMFNKLNKGLEA